MVHQMKVVLSYVTLLMEGILVEVLTGLKFGLDVLLLGENIMQQPRIIVTVLSGISKGLADVLRLLQM